MNFTFLKFKKKHNIKSIYFIFQVFTTSQELTPTCKCRNINTIARVVVLWEHRQCCLGVSTESHPGGTVPLYLSHKCLNTIENHGRCLLQEDILTKKIALDLYATSNITSMSLIRIRRPVFVTS